MPKNSAVTVYATGHTHIDVSWLWRLKHTREKAQRSFATVLRLMEEYPEYHFLQTQPQLYKFLKKTVLKFTKESNSECRKDAGRRMAACGWRRTVM